MLWTDHNYPSEPQHCLGHAESGIFVRAIKILALSGNSTDIPRAEGAATHRSGSDRHRHQSARRDRFSVLRAPVKPKSLAGPSVGRRTRSVHTKIRSTYIRVPTKSPRVSAAVPMKYAGPSPTPDAPAPLPRRTKSLFEVSATISFSGPRDRLAGQNHSSKSPPRSLEYALVSRG